ncbi:MAG TPA: FHA domain-containing protein, partial [Aggregatilineales bacterium]|nr:FHA domain-containing protein [Aggregatilineales bacterium]
MPGTLYCEDCAEPLHDGMTLPSEVVQHYLDNLTDDRAWGILFSEGGFWIMLQPEMLYTQRRRLVKSRLVLGRLDSSDDFTTIKLDTPEIDKLGVSRLHAALVPLEHGVGLQDVGSTNGTRLNGQRLAEGRIYNLTDRDKIELGKFPVQVYFLDQIRFLRAIHDSLVNQFAEDVQILLEDMDMPTEALSILLERLPGMTIAQIQVLSLFKERNEPVTLEHLHERINKAMGDMGISTRPE